MNHAQVGEKERERERERDIYIHIYYIYIDGERQRERERERVRERLSEKEGGGELDDLGNGTLKALPKPIPIGILKAPPSILPPKVPS